MLARHQWILFSAHCFGVGTLYLSRHTCRTRVDSSKFTHSHSFYSGFLGDLDFHPTFCHSFGLLLDIFGLLLDFSWTFYSSYLDLDTHSFTYGSSGYLDLDPTFCHSFGLLLDTLGYFLDFVTIYFAWIWLSGFISWTSWILWIWIRPFVTLPTISWTFTSSTLHGSGLSCNILAIRHVSSSHHDFLAIFGFYSLLDHLITWIDISFLGSGSTFIIYWILFSWTAGPFDILLASCFPFLWISGFWILFYPYLTGRICVLSGLDWDYLDDATLHMHHLYTLPVPQSSLPSSLRYISVPRLSRLLGFSLGSLSWTGLPGSLGPWISWTLWIFWTLDLLDFLELWFFGPWISALLVSVHYPRYLANLGPSGKGFVRDVVVTHSVILVRASSHDHRRQSSIITSSYTFEPCSSSSLLRVRSMAKAPKQGTAMMIRDTSAPSLYSNAHHAPAVFLS